MGYSLFCDATQAAPSGFLPQTVPRLHSSPSWHSSLSTQGSEPQFRLMVASYPLSEVPPIRPCTQTHTVPETGVYN